MQISISNLTDGELINHSLVLIEGEVVEQCVELQNTSITVCLVGKPAEISETIAWPVSLVSGKFKALVELLAGVNNVQLCCGDCIRWLTLTYEPPTLENVVRLIYVVAEDDMYNGSFQGPTSDEVDGEGIDRFTRASACARIWLGAKLIQTFTAECAVRHGLGRRTFRLETDPLSHDQPYCRTLTLRGRTTHQVAHLPENELWHAVKDELASCRNFDFGGADASRVKFLAFVSFTRYRNDDRVWPLDHHDMLQLTEGHVALGGGGLALLGTGCLHTWAERLADVVPCFTDARKIDRFTLLDDSCYRGTYGACYSTTLGAACHELGHTFDLGHTVAGIMGRGFDNLRNVFVLPELLSGDDDGDRPPRNTPCNQSTIASQSEPSHCLIGMSLPNNVTQMANNQFLTETKLCRRFKDWKGAYWCRDSAVWLSFHRWFNSSNPKNSGHGPKIYGCELRSRHGLRVIIATPAHANGASSRHWEFLSSHGCLTYRLNLEDFGLTHEENSGKPVIVHVQALDSYGNTMSSMIEV